MPKKQRRTFSAEFKLQVVQMIRERGVSVGEGCRDMKLGKTGVRRWLAQADEKATGRPGIDKPLATEQQSSRASDSSKLRKSNCAATSTS